MNQQTSYSNMFQTIIMKSSIFIIIHTFQPHCAARTALEIWPPYPFFFLRDDIHTRQTISVFACIGNTKKNAVVQHRAVFALMISLFVFCFASSFCAAWFLFGIRFDRPRLPGKSNGRGWVVGACQSSAQCLYLGCSSSSIRSEVIFGDFLY